VDGAIRAEQVAARQEGERGMRPIVLAANNPERFYRGGARIAAFRGLPERPEYQPEDWVASTTTLFGQSRLGLTVLDDGRLLRDAVQENPAAWLGEEHVAAYGDDVALLVKLLDAGQRLPVHVHPDRAFASRHLGCAHGKTEAWLMLSAEPGSQVYLGWNRDVSADELAEWVRRQDREAMLAAMHAVQVRAGEGVLVPAGTPHAIGAGVLLVELQEPTDLSVLLEWDGFAVDGPAEGHLGLGFDTALGCVDLAEMPAERLAALHTDADGPPLPADAGDFFRAERLAGGDTVQPGFAVLVVTAGVGVLDSHGGRLDLRRGSTILLAHAAGPARLDGDLQVLVCRPPAAPG